MLTKVATWLAILIASSYLVVGIFPPSRDISLDPQKIRPEAGKAFVISLADLGIKGLVTVKSDYQTDLSSTVRLYENGVELGPPHTMLDSIRRLGLGRFSHLDRRLYFSSSDGTSPLSNGRHYILRAHFYPALPLHLLGVLATLWVIRQAIRRSPAAVRKRIKDVLHAALFPTTGKSRFVTSAVLLTVSTAGAVLFLFYAWKTAHTTDFAIGSLFQVSDASNYADCANRILDRGIIGTFKDSTGEWCSRRITYPTFLATLMAATGRDWLLTLLIQGAVLGWGIGLMAATVTRALGLLAGAGTLWYQFNFAKHAALGATSTENAGVIFGSIGAALVFDGARRESKTMQIVGTALMSLALNARAGAFFVLPLIVIWAYSATPGSNVDRIKHVVLVALAGASGFFLQAFLVKAYSGNLGASHSNFAYVLYGLSVGGKTWWQVHLDHPDLFQKNYSDAKLATTIFELAKDNILASPSLFLKAFGFGILRYLKKPMLEMQGAGWFNLVAVTWWLGAALTAYRWREPQFRLIALLSLGIVLSAPFLVYDGGSRVFAASWSITVMQVSIGLWALARMLAAALAGTNIGGLASSPSRNILGVASSIGIFAALFAPLILSSEYQTKSVKKTQGCDSNDGELVTRLGKESYAITLLPPNSDGDLFKSQFDYNQLKRGFVGNWIETGFDTVTPPATVIRGYQLATGTSLPFGTIVPLVAEKDLGPFFGKTVSICFSTAQTKRFAELDYYRIDSIRAFEPN